MKASELHPSKYLRASDLGEKPVLYTMTFVQMESVADGEEKKPVLYFTKQKKGLVLNKTNKKVIMAAYGDETDEWEGKPIVLFPAMVNFRDDLVEAIRVRMPKATARPGGPKPIVKEPEPEQEHDELNPPTDMDEEIPF